MGGHFDLIPGNRVRIRLSSSERALLQDVLVFVTGIEASPASPNPRSRIPVYLGDAESSEEWSRLMGEQLDRDRSADRQSYTGIVKSDEREVVVDFDQAEAFLRVVNNGRLALADRMGIEVEEDYALLAADEEMVLGFLGYLVNDLSAELARRYEGPAPS